MGVLGLSLVALPLKRLACCRNSVSMPMFDRELILLVNQFSLCFEISDFVAKLDLHCPFADPSFLFHQRQRTFDFRNTGFDFFHLRTFLRDLFIECSKFLLLFACLREHGGFRLRDIGCRRVRRSYKGEGTVCASLAQRLQPCSVKFRLQKVMTCAVAFGVDDGRRPLRRPETKRRARSRRAFARGRAVAVTVTSYLIRLIPAPE